MSHACSQHENFILNHYLKQFNEETIKTKKFQHCGEPCPVVCKKMFGQYKKDYEPYHVLGPQVGVFDQRAAELLNDFVDAMGFDSIQSGGTVAWIMELVRDGLIDPSEFGLPPADEMCFDWADDPSQFDIVADSMKNAQYAMNVVQAILFEPKAEWFRRSIRVAAQGDRQALWHPQHRPGGLSSVTATKAAWSRTNTGCRACSAPCR